VLMGAVVTDGPPIGNTLAGNLMTRSSASLRRDVAKVQAVNG
jgi:hypothetical protein